MKIECYFTRDGTPPELGFDFLEKKTFTYMKMYHEVIRKSSFNQKV